MSDFEMQVNTLHPEKGDLLVLKVPQILKREQRESLQVMVGGIADQFGCKSVVQEGGIDLLLLKAPADEQTAKRSE